MGKLTTSLHGTNNEIMFTSPCGSSPALRGECEDFDLFVMLAGTCGLRWGEITALTRDDVALGQRPSISITKAYSEVRGQLILGSTKGGESRTVPLPRLIAARLERHSGTATNQVRLFSGARGSALRNNTWTRRHYAPAIRQVSLRVRVG